MAASVVQWNPALRLIPPSRATGDRWAAENLLKRRRYRITKDAASVLVMSVDPLPVNTLVAELADGVDGALDQWREVVERLCAAELLVAPEWASTDAATRQLTGVRRAWASAGWVEAAEYHLLSFDYPCVDYAEGDGLMADHTRMRTYQSAEADTDRIKLDYADQPGIELPQPSASQRVGSTHDLWCGTASPRVLDRGALMSIVSLTFGQIGTRNHITDSAPTLRRSSPSGGGRHPSEGYVAVEGVTGVPDGWYHITMDPFSLRSVPAPEGGARSLAEALTCSANWDDRHPRAFVVVTSKFERNMYRYREPRTFRTVHMDAGHLAATARLVARSQGLDARIYSDVAAEVEAALGLNPMEEGYMATVAVGSLVNEESV